MKFICINSNTTLAGHNALFGLLRELNDGDSRHVFIVPDRYTLGVEREICQKIYPDGSFNVDVCSFTRLAQKALGKKNKRCLSKEGTVLLMDEIIRSVDSSLDYYKGVKGVAFSREMFASIASLRSSGVTVDDIYANLDSIEGATKEKLRDVAVIYKAYLDALGDGLFDTVTRVDWLKDNAENVAFVKDAYFYVLGFNVFSAQQIAVIEKFICAAKSVAAAFCVSEGGSNADCFLTAQRDILTDFCEKKGVPVEIRRSTQVLGQPFDFLHREMYGFSSLAGKNDSDAVKICSYRDMYAEVTAVAKEISYIALSGKERYRDVAVVSNNDAYCEIIKTIFNRFAIPYFIDEKYYVKNGFFARYALAVFAAAERNMERREMLAVCRHPYSGFDRSEIQHFENYCLKYNVTGEAMKQPFLYEDNPEAEKVRIKLVRIITDVPRAALFGEYCEKIEKLAESEDVISLDEKFAASKDTAVRVYADRRKFLEVTAEIKAIGGKRNAPISDFIDTLSSVIDNTSVSVAPQFIDSVFVGNTSESRFDGVKTMFVVGANDGYFPVTGGDKLIFGDCDAEIMKHGGIRIFPTPLETNAFSRFTLIDILSKPEKLFVSYALSDAGGAALPAGGGVRELLFRLGAEEKPFVTYHDFSEEEELGYNLATDKNCYYEYMAGSVPPLYRKSVGGYLESKGYAVDFTRDGAPCDLTDNYEKTADGAYKISVSKMETYFRCPFRNYLSNALGLREREEGEMRVNEKGTVIHDVLQRYFSAGGKFLREADAKKLTAFAERCIGEVFALPDNGRFAETALGRKELDGIRKECVFALKILTENLRHSRFNPVLLEKSFGADGEISLESGGKKFVFTGRVDRVDADADKNIIIIDYKTGTVKEGLEYVYSGEKIQLYLYLYYFLGKGCKPAGVFYLPLSDGYRKNSVTYAMKGQMLNSVGTFRKLDDRVSETENGKYGSPTVDFHSEKDGETEKFAKNNLKNLLEDEDFSAISAYAVELCRVALKDIADGDDEKKPSEKACDYCPYAKICGERDCRAKISVCPSDFRGNGGNE
jgi:ATP-dependent helicase/nuclease subunit B